MQICPIFLNDLRTAPFTASFKSASLQTIIGKLPPNSNDTFLRDFAASTATPLPTFVEPVKASFFTSGLFTNSFPITAPGPVTVLITPGEIPVSTIALTNASGERGVSEGNLHTIVQPADNAAATFQARSSTG